MAKLSETYKIPEVKNTTVNGGGSSAPVSSGRKLSETYRIGENTYKAPTVTFEKEIPSLKPIQPVQTEVTVPTIDNSQKQGFWSTLWNTIQGNTMRGVSPTGASNISAGYSQAVAQDTHDTVKNNVEKQNYFNTTRQQELRDFDAKDTSRVLYNSPSVKLTKAKLDLWLDPSYEMSPAEMKQAREAVNVLSNFKNYKQYFGDMDAKEAGEIMQQLTSLGTRASSRERFARGAAEAIPGIKAIERGAAKLLGNEDVLKEDAARIENTTAYKLGKGASKIGQYYALNASGILKPLASKLGGWLTPKVASSISATYNSLGASETAVNAALALGESMTNHVTNILSDEVADILLDTLPEMAENIRDGMSGKEVAKAVLENLGLNLAYNVGGEIIMNYKDIKNALIGKYNLPEETAEVVAKELPNIIDDVAKETTGEAPKITVEEVKAPEIKPNVEPVVKQTEEVAESVAPSVDLGGQTVKATNTPIEELKPVEKPVANELPKVEYTKKQLKEINDFVKKADELERQAKTLEANGMSDFLAWQELWNEEEKIFKKYPELFEDGVFKGLPEVEQTAVKQTLPEVKPKNEVMAEDTGLNSLDSTTLEVPAESVIDADKFKPLEPMEEPIKFKEVYNPHEASTRESKLFTNTFSKEGLANMADEVDKRAAQYIKHYNADVLHDAEKDVAENGASLLNEYIKGSKHVATDGDVDRVMLLAHELKDRISKAVKSGATVEELEPLRFQYELIRRRLREAETGSGQMIQALAKWNGTAEGAISSAEMTIDKAGREWAKKNANSSAVKKIKKAAEELTNSRVDKALENMGFDGTIPKTTNKLTREQLESQVRNSIGKEFSAVGQQFNDDDVKVLADMVENKTPIEVMTDEIEHRLNHGTWYPYYENPVPKEVTNKKLDNILASIGDTTEKVKKSTTPKSFAEVREEIINSFKKEHASVLNDLSDADIDYITTLMTDKTISKETIQDEIEHYLKHGTWYSIDESIAEAKPENTRLKKILSDMLNESEPVAKEPLSREAVREQVRNTLEKELGSVEKFSDADVEYIANLMQSGATSKEITDALQSRIATGAWGISDEAINRVNELWEEASRYKPGSKQRVDTEKKVWETLADDIFKNGSSFAEKLDAFRYVAMLGNPKTWGKNIISTAEMHMVDGVSNNLAALIEAGAQKAGLKFERTKAILNPASKSDSSLIQNALKDATDTSWAKLTNEGRWGKATDEINRARKIYDTKTMNAIADAPGNVLEKSDEWFLKQKYATSLAGYLKANGADPKIVFDAEYLLQIAKEKRYSEGVIRPLQQQIDILNKGREYAVKEAQYATFHADNEIADAIQAFKKKLNTSEKASSRTLGKIVEGFIPFVKTPANVLKNTFDFSPVSYFKVFKDAKQYGAAKAIDDIAKGTTGLGLMFAGYALADAGFAHGKASDYEKAKGIQDYSFNLFGKSVNVADIMSGNAGFFVGVALHDELAKKGYSFSDVIDTMKKDGFGEGLKQIPWNDALNSLAGMTEPISETSMLTGVTNLINSVKNSDHPVPAALATLGTNYFTQLVPTALGQGARSIDNTRRDTYAPDSGAIGSIEKNVEKVQNKLPVLSMQNEPYIDMWGREQKNSPFENPIGRTAYQFGFPAYMGNVEDNNPVFKELDRLGAIDGISIDEITPGYYSTSINGQRLSQKDNTTYRKATGGARYDGIETALHNANYKNLTDTQKAEVIKSIYSLANTIGKNAVTGNGASEDSPEFKAYYNNGKPSMGNAIDFIIGKYAMNQSGISTSNDDARAAFEKDGQSGLDAYTGVTAKDRQNAQQIIPSLDYSQILKTDKNDANAKSYVDANTAIPYLRKQNLSDSEMGEVLYNSGTKSKESIDVYKNLGYDGVYQYYAMKADASALNPDGKDTSLDQKEKVVYLYNQGYTYKQINDWLKLLGSEKGITEKKFLDIIQASKSWK